MTEPRYEVWRKADYDAGRLAGFPCRAPTEFSVLVSEYMVRPGDLEDERRCRQRIYDNHALMFTWVWANLDQSSVVYEQFDLPENWLHYRAVVYLGDMTEAAAFRLRWC